MDIETLHRRMKKVGGKIENGVRFVDDKVVLWWKMPNQKLHEISLYRHQLTVTSSDFQNIMKKAELDLNKKIKAFFGMTVGDEQMSTIKIIVCNVDALEIKK